MKKFREIESALLIQEFRKGSGDSHVGMVPSFRQNAARTKLSTLLLESAVIESVCHAPDLPNRDHESDKGGDQQPGTALDRQQNAGPKNDSHSDPNRKSVKQFHETDVSGLRPGFNSGFAGSGVRVGRDGEQPISNHLQPTTHHPQVMTRKYSRLLPAFRNIGADHSAGVSRSDMKARIIITPKKAVVDPQGKAVQKALEQMGYSGIDAVHVGKYLEIELNGADPETARRQLDEACHKFLSNPVIEDYKLEMV